MWAGEDDYVPLFLRVVVDILGVADVEVALVVSGLRDWLLVQAVRLVIVLVHVIGPVVALKLTMLSPMVSLCRNLLIR